jgi:hypothetical protein
MGIDEGFDIYPALSTNDRDAWVAFLKDVVALYKSDPAVVQKVDRIEFNVGEGPTLHFGAERTVSGSCGKARSYIASFPTQHPPLE